MPNSIYFQELLNTLQDIEYGSTLNVIPNYPPCNVYYDESEKDDKKRRFIEFGVSGFSSDDIKVSIHTNDDGRKELKVEGQSEPESDSIKYVYRKLAKRNFSSQVPLHKHHEIEEVTLKDGILRISLIINVPEEDKPKYFEIK